MPYKIFSEDGKHCVYKMTESGDKSKLLKCYSGKSGASAYQRALYAAENKEVDMTDELEKELAEEQSDEETKETAEKHVRFSVPWGIHSFVQLDQYREDAEEIKEMRDDLDDYSSLVYNIATNSEVEDKSAAFKKLAAEFYIIQQKEIEKEIEEASEETLTNKVKKIILGLFDKKEEKQSDFIIWKEKDGTLKWMARYSNKYRDKDVPPEIISSESHERFVKLVDEGKATLPELFVWHIPEFRFGQATHVAYDNSGFALAAGVIDDTKEAKDIAELLSVQKGISVSHGMPTSTIVRDPDDETVIIQHETVEISVLPTWAAANKMTDFVIIDSETKEKSMAIPDSKFESLVDDWGADPELLKRLEGRNKADAEAADKAGIESKELEEEEQAETTETTETTEEVENVAEAETESKEDADKTDTTETSAETETAAEETEKPADEGDPSQSEDILTQPPTRQEVVDFLADTIKPYLERIGEVEKQVGDVEGKIDIVLGAVKELALSDEEMIQKAVLDTPAASMSAILAERFSAVGKETTSVDGRSSLAKSKPDETPPPASGIPFIDALKSGDDVGGKEYFSRQ